MAVIPAPVRRVAAVAAVTCGGASAAALLAACASATSPSTAASSVTPGGPASSVTSSAPASPSPASPATAAARPQCATSALEARVSTTAGGAAAGSAYVPIDFTNISTSSCVMYGYPGVSWVTGLRGSQIGNPAARTPGFSLVSVTVPPGGHAHAWLQIADAGNFPASACHPVTAHWMKIYPPNQFSALYARYTATVCSGKNTGSSKPLLVDPVRAGDAAAGHVP